MITKHRAEGEARGGILCYVKNCFDVVVLDTIIQDCECLHLKIHCKSVIVTDVIVLYRPPSWNLTNFVNSLETFLEKQEERKLIVLGDLNIDLLNRESRNTSEYLNIMRS